MNPGQPRRIGRGLLGYGVLPLIPAAIAWLFAGASLPAWAQADISASALPLTSSDLSLFHLFWQAHWLVKQ